MNVEYDAIVVGARCAGSPTAMPLARKGYRVLLVDRATFPSDAMSTHIVHPRGVAALDRWGLLERLQRTGCPPIAQYSFDFGPVTICGSPEVRGMPRALCPRRVVLDEILVKAAVEAGAELHEGFTVDDIVMENGRVIGVRGHSKAGAPLMQRARIVIGADGLRSRVAKAVRPEQYLERPTMACSYYAYWSGLPAERFEGYIRPQRAFAVLPTHDGLTIGIFNWPRSEFESHQRDVEGTCLRTFELVPDLHERVRSARRVTRYVGTANLPNFIRKPFGPGWVLIGDAGYHKDPITAQGISDAFRDAEAMAAALDNTFAGRARFDDAMTHYQRARDEAALPMFELTCQFASHEPPPPEEQQLLEAMQGNQDAMDGYMSVLAGTIPPATFFDPQNVARIMAGAAAAA